MITVVLFDLGSTLIYAKDPWPPIFQRADRALVEALQRANIGIDKTTFYEEFGSFIGAYYANREEDTVERTAFAALSEMLAQKGFQNIPDPVLRTALDAMYAITQSNWCAEDDAIPTLDTLKSQGHRLGMISNTSDDQNVQGLVDRWGFRPYFEIIVTSAALGVRKPDRRIFQAALDHFGVAPERVAMVGDTLEADILGANQMGMYSIWITQRADRSDPSLRSGQIPQPARPQAVINTLSEIPNLLKSL
jgi:HAD superfamily phosphatase (TIGR01668 family)